MFALAGDQQTSMEQASGFASSFHPAGPFLRLRRPLHDDPGVEHLHAGVTEGLAARLRSGPHPALPLVRALLALPPRARREHPRLDRRQHLLRQSVEPPRPGRASSSSDGAPATWSVKTSQVTRRPSWSASPPSVSPDRTRQDCLGNPHARRSRPRTHGWARCNSVAANDALGYDRGSPQDDELQ